MNSSSFRPRGPANRMMLRGRRALGGMVALAVVSVTLTSCLMPGEVDPTGKAPIGSIDMAVAAGSSIRVSGWALDPETAAPVEIRIAFHGTTSGYVANGYRPDIAAAYPGYGAAHGFDVRSPDLGPGVKQVCVWIINVGVGEDRVLGCQDVQMGSNDAVGSFDSVTQVAPGIVRASGWAFDRETDASTSVAYSLDGGPAVMEPTTVVRPDVNGAFAITGVHGFLFDVAAAVGRHTLCLTAVNVDRGNDADLGCRVVDVNQPTSISAGAGISAVQAVGPPPGHPLVGIDRDGGISTQLRDGSILWIFADSLARNPNGDVRYFVNNTAALATSGSPTVTKDAVAAGNVPYTFVSPSTVFTTPCPDGFTPVMWPLSATNVPVAASNNDRVIAFFGDVCLNGTDARSRGVAVVEWIYDPAAHDGRPILGTVLHQNLFPVGAEYGTASLIDGGFLYAYECGRPVDGLPGPVWPDDPAYTGCTVARVDPASVATRSAWRYWNGTAWMLTPPSQPSPESGALMVIPGAGTNKQTPVSSFTISNDPVFGYTMTYSPWPGYTDEVYVRTASSPIGPWSVARLIKLPNCNEWAGGGDQVCYAATAQPWRSRSGQIGLGWFDQYVDWNPLRGSYLSGNAPF